AETPAARPAAAVGPPWPPPAASSVTSSFTRATMQASLPTATDFFNSLLVLVERAKLAEASGYDTVWLADERFYREVYACLTLFAANTARVRLGPCVTDPFARHPALTAMAIATIDEISGGRAVLGIGAGISG